MRALRIYAGPRALRHIQAYGLRASDVVAIPGAAGGPKGLTLGPLDRYLFGHWLAGSTQPIDLVGASIGAWRLATACLREPVRAFERLEHDYIRQEFEFPPGRRMPRAEHVSQRFSQSLDDFYGGRIAEVLAHPRYRLHVVTSRGRHLLRREHRIATPVGYLGAFASNTLHRRALGLWLERVVFSAGGAALPFEARDLRTRQVPLTPENFFPALQASCSIPFALKAVHDIPGAPPGAYWDGGITDYHLHLNFSARPGPPQQAAGIVLYPHFQRQVVPGWLDKRWSWRHGATPFLDNMVVLAPAPEWVRGLPGGKLPDRTDFSRFGRDTAARAAVWGQAVAESHRLADEFAAWQERPDLSRIEPL